MQVLGNTILCACIDSGTAKVESAWKCGWWFTDMRVWHEDLKKHHGDIFRNAGEKSDVDGRIAFVELADGKKVYARIYLHFIWTQTMEMIRMSSKNAYRNRMKSLENSVSSFYCEYWKNIPCLTFRNQLLSQ